MIMRTGIPSRILMTADTVGGVWTYSIELARALSAEGVEVVLATMGSSATDDQRRQARAIESVELYESEYRLPWMERPWPDIQRARDWLLGLAVKTKPDLIHLNEPVYGSVEWSLPTIAVAHSCVLSWWESVRGGAAPANWHRYRQEMRRGLRAASVVVAPSTWMLETLRRNYGVERGRAIANGRDHRSFIPRAKAPLVFAAGRLWDRAKNLQALEAIAEGLPWPIYVAGDLHEPGGVASVDPVHIHQLGRLPEASVAAWLGRASIYALPARYEPFGLSVLEAALCGCTLVLGDLPTLREFWNGAAIFVSPDETPTLRLAIEELVKDPGLRQALAMRAHRRALTLSPRRMALAYLDLYGELLRTAETGTREAACAS
jgi:glycogen(starch) synthase